ncbi:hypothetical protein GCM10009802_26910 [Streptomyces synnematoformans]|uniref:Uncharacterized protein n=1 Tax=Streptomyces synnematoformans TaxID=415721 RepID=A0ABP5JZU9_9ACTN
MTATADRECVVTLAELKAVVSDGPVHADIPPAVPRPRHRRQRSRSLPGPVHRVRAEVRRGGTGGLWVDEHVRAGLHAPAPWPRLADVLLAAGGGPGDVRAAAERHPGALVVAGYRGGQCWLCYGSRVLSLHVAADAPGPGRCWHAVASAVHAWLTAGILTDPTPGPVRLGETPPPADGTRRCPPYLRGGPAPQSSSSRRSRSRTASARGESEPPEVT